MKKLITLVALTFVTNIFAVDQLPTEQENKLICDLSVAVHETDIEINDLDKFKKDIKKIIKGNKHDEAYFSNGEDVTSIILINHTDDPIFSESESFNVYSGTIYNGSDPVLKLLQEDLKLTDYDVPSGCVMLEDLKLKRNLKKISDISYLDGVTIEFREGDNHTWYQYAKDPTIVEAAKELIEYYRASGEIER